MVDVLHHAQAYLESLPSRPAGPPVDADALRAALAVELTAEGVDPQTVIDELVAAAGPGIVATAGPRYFGFVTGGALPAALAADWLTSVWDQNAHMWVGSPAAMVVEEVVEDWVLSLLGLPANASVGLVTGAQMANVTCLAVARDVQLKRAGWDAASQGLIGAPPLVVIAGEQAHATIFTALRMLGLGRDSAHLVASDDQGRMDPDALASVLKDVPGPAIVCAQAGNVNSGAFDPLEPIEYLCEQSEAWLHVDGAFGLWAAASPRLKHLTRGLERADSWATDAHKWLNVPYDSGLAVVRDRVAHRASLGVSAAYLVESEHRDAYDYTPEASRRARGFAIYAALRELGRDGLAAMIDRHCAQARRFAQVLADGGAEVLNDVVLNQVLVAASPEAVARIQADGTCWAGGTVWHGRPALRISVSNWSTTDADVERSAAAILSAIAA
jgi:glutamate/tyrosine decarboxylase-like PLP-dependent enzyme